jgi:hypothetical protein
MPQADTEVEVAHESWKDLPADDRDCILMVKQYMHDTRYSQKPILMQPHAIGSSLNKGDLKPVPRNELGERAIKEYRRTADAVCQPPWNLLKASAYLKKLCDDNESGVPGTPPTLDFIFRDKIRSDTSMLSGLVGITDLHDPPRRVVVAAKKAAAKKKPKAKPMPKAKPKARPNKRPAAAPPPGADALDDEGADQADEATADYSTSTPPPFKTLRPRKKFLNSRNSGFL